MSTRDANDDQDRGKHDLLVCKAWDGSRSSEFRTQFLRATSHWVLLIPPVSRDRVQ